MNARCNKNGHVNDFMEKCLGMFGVCFLSQPCFQHVPVRISWSRHGHMMLWTFWMLSQATQAWPGIVVVSSFRLTSLEFSFNFTDLFHKNIQCHHRPVGQKPHLNSPNELPRELRRHKAFSEFSVRSVESRFSCTSCPFGSQGCRHALVTKKLTRWQMKDRSEIHGVIMIRDRSRRNA